MSLMYNSNCAYVK